MSRSECWAGLEPRDPERIDELLTLVGEAWKANPDLRLGQLLFALKPAGKDLFCLEDSALKDILLAVTAQVSQGKSLAEVLSAIPR